MLNNLLLSGKLVDQLHEIDETCNARLELLLPQIQATDGVTEELKATDQLEWVCCMNVIRHQVEGTLLKELICV